MLGLEGLRQKDSICRVKNPGLLTGAKIRVEAY